MNTLLLTASALIGILIVERLDLSKHTARFIKRNIAGLAAVLFAVQLAFALIGFAATLAAPQ
jgi:hypothetical protein